MFRARAGVATMDGVNWGSGESYNAAMHARSDGLRAVLRFRRRRLATCARRLRSRAGIGDTVRTPPASRASPSTGRATGNARRAAAGRCRRRCPRQGPPPARASAATAGSAGRRNTATSTRSRRWRGPLGSSGHRAAMRARAANSSTYGLTPPSPSISQGQSMFDQDLIHEISRVETRTDSAR